jgi:hypothetical protein
MRTSFVIRGLAAVIVVLLLLVNCTDSGSVAPSSCPLPSEHTCAGVCADLNTDPKNCGACGTTCASDGVCVNGACASSCPAGQTACAGACVDLATNSANCGVCGTACTGGLLCTGGACKSACDPGLAACTTAGAITCANVQTDSKNCGACGVACGVGESCQAGACKCASPNGCAPSSLVLDEGTANPTATNEPPTAADVVMLQFALRSTGTEAAKVKSVTLTAAGSANDATTITSVQLIRDTDGNGYWDQGKDVVLGDAKQFADDNGTVTFGTLDELIQAGTTSNFLVVYNLNGSASVGQTLSVSIASGMAIEATNPANQAPLAVTGAAAGAEKTISQSGTLSVSLGSNSPGATNESAEGSGVTMLQFALSSSQVESFSVTSITVKGAGTGNDATNVSSVKLYRDVDGDGVVDVGSDVLLGSGVYAANDGVVAFASLSETIAAGSTTHYLVTYDFSGASLGSTFAASVVSGASVTASGATSGPAGGLVVGSAAGATKTILGAGSLTISTGTASPGTTFERPGADVSMLQVALSASSVEGVKVTGLSVRSSGSGADNTGVTAVKLYRDANNNGVYDAGETQVGTTGTFSIDNGFVVFSGLTEVISVGTTTNYVVVYTLAANVLPGDTFSASINPSSSVTATGQVSMSPVAASGTATGATKTVQAKGSLTLAAGVANPAATNERQGATLVPVLQLDLAASSVEPIRLDSVTIRATGTGNDATGITAVKFYRDTNRNGTVDAGDIQLGSTQTFNADNGAALFSNLANTIDPSSSGVYLVTFDVANSVLAGQTFTASVATNAIIATGTQSNQSISVIGSGLTGASKTIQTVGSVTIAAGASSPGASNEMAGSTGVPMLQFVATTSSVEAVRVQSVSVRASGTGNDAIGISAVRLFRDNNGNGRVDAGEPQLGTSTVFSSDNGSATFAGLTDLISADSFVNYLVTVDIASSAQVSQTFAVSVAFGAAVQVRGEVSNTNILPAGGYSSGGAAGNTKTIQSASLQLVAGTANPSVGDVSPSAAGVPMLQFRLNSLTSESVRVENVTVTAIGTANDTTAISAVKFYRDVNDNGLVDAGDVLIRSSTYAADNGTIDFNGLSEIIPGNSGLSYLVVYDLSGAGVSGNTLFARIAATSAVSAVSTTTSAAATLVGGAVQGGVKTITSQLDVWTPTSITGSPSARSQHTAVSTGTEMIVWGGDNGTTRLGDGARYNPSTDTWTVLPSTGAPSARARHVAALVGTKMIVWGGTADGISPLGDGAVYDTTSGAWTAISAVNAPTARFSPSIVSTGTEVIIFGGVGTGATTLSTGARYNPSTDVWTSLPTTANVPSVRYQHVASWMSNVGTSGRMFIWGGNSGTATLNTGSVYDLASDSWTTVTSTGAPAATSQSAAVYTGAEVVLSGGYTGSAFSTLAAAFNPTAGSWRTLSATGAPAARARHSLVLVGSRIIAWGGWNGTTSLNSGAVLDPLENLWTSTSTINAPSSRDSHTGVLVGPFMIVWGGKTTSAPLGTGARYVP